MVFFHRAPLADQQPSVSDGTVIIKDLPKKGCLSGIDLKFLVANLTHANGNPSGHILDCINKIEVVLNGDIRYFSMSGIELFQHLWQVNGKPPYHEFNGRNSEEAFVHFPIRFGRYLGDPQFGLKLDNWSSAQLLVDYALDPVGDDSDGAPTGFLTGTTKMSAMLHITPPDKIAPFQACIGTRQYYTGSTVANDVMRMELPRQNPLVGMGLFCHKSATSMSAVASKASFELNNGNLLLIRGRWYDHVRIQSENLTDIEQRYLTLWTTGKTLDLQLNWINNIQVKPMYNTPTNSAQNCIRAPELSVSGGLLTMAAGPALNIDLDASPTIVPAANAINQPYDMIVKGYPDRYIYWPMGNRMDMLDIINPNQYSLMEAVLECGATGGAGVSLIVEELRAA